MNEVLTNITDKQEIRDLIDRALEEDIKSGDVTTNSVIDPDKKAEAVWIAKQQGIVAGLDLARAVFEKLDPELAWESAVEDGASVKAGVKILKMNGTARAILAAERVALNFAQRMSGIATLANQFVKTIDGYPVKILDTRKTVPGLRILDKYAVAAGGGTNHRMGLYDLAMIKDNHIVAAGSITKAVQKVHANYPDLRIEVETTTLDQVEEAISAGADIIMLDNMSPEQMQRAVTEISGRAETEASGNITLDNVREVAETGVDFISVGALTHSVNAFDISQQLQRIY